jgi:aminoglycoside phosphotransferase (APT) family kinase protein
MNLEECLPAELRTPETTLTRIAAGLSGAGVYRVDASGRAVVLKVGGADEPVAAWRRKLQIQQLAADAGVAPRILHTDEGRRAVVSELVADRSFPALYADPGKRDGAIVLLGRMLRRVHELPVPAGAEPADARAFLEKVSAELADFPLPRFVVEAIGGALAEQAPPSDRAPVVSHNDVNPTNLAYDGERLLLLDWDTAGLNDPLYDLASIAVFLRMDDATCCALLAAHDDAPAAELPPRFAYNRRLMAVLGGTVFLQLARRSGHPGATGAETLDNTASLIEFYQQMRTGALNIATAAGQWAFGLALVKSAVASGGSAPLS